VSASKRSGLSRRPGTSPGQPLPRSVESRAPAGRGRAWAHRTKILIAALGVGAFLAAAVAVPGTARGHTKRPSRPLAAPNDFVHALRSDRSSANASVLPAATAAAPASGTS
jgi:hypothetical protein